jgi:putative heme-binding domain-containing protein
MICPLRKSIILAIFAGLLFIGCSTKKKSTLETRDGFRVPPGFEVTLYADHTLAHSIFKMTTDPQGRLVVSGRDEDGSGYMKVLEDTDGDRRADRAVHISDFHRQGARGLYVEGNDLIINGGGGLWRLPSYEQMEGSWEENRELLFAHTGGAWHNANSVLKGPDGWLYMIYSDAIEIDFSDITLPGSPVKGPVQGALLRIAPDGSDAEVVSHGFRNPYDMTFNAYGNIFQFDSDGERVQYLPLYVPTRVYDLATGMKHGWIDSGTLQEYWNPPPHFYDHTEPMIVPGRGSPTGVISYRHRQFPERYHDGLFLGDWSLGRIYFVPHERKGSTYGGELELFVQAISGQGFAITAMEVGPEGDIFVATGGGGTRGEIYRISYKGDDVSRPSEADDPLRRVLAADQPLASWSRAGWIPEARSLGRDAFESAVVDEALPVKERIRALEVLVEVFEGVSVELIEQVALDPDTDPEVVSRAMWAATRTEAAASPGREGKRIRTLLSEMTRREDPRIARAAWENLGSVPRLEESMDVAWLQGFDADDRRVRQAAAMAARGAGYNNFVQAVGANDLGTPRQWLGYLYVHGPGVNGQDFFRMDDKPAEDRRTIWIRHATDVFEKAEEAVTKTDALRLLQIGLGDIDFIPGAHDVDDGYRGADTGEIDPSLLNELAGRLAPHFPTGYRTTDVELARVMAILERSPGDFLERLTGQWMTEGWTLDHDIHYLSIGDGTDFSPVEDDIHYLHVYSRLPGQRTDQVIDRAARAVVGLQLKMEEQANQLSMHWAKRVTQLAERLFETDSALAGAVASQPEFRLAEHALIAGVLPEPYKTEAARSLLAAAVDREEEGERAFTPDLLELVSMLPPEEFLPVMRRHRKEPVLRETIVSILADHAEPADRDFLIEEALTSRRGVIVEQAAVALMRLDDRPAAEDWQTAMQALGHYAGLSGSDQVVQSLSELLQHWADMDESGAGDASFSAVSDTDDIYEYWMEWLADTYPGIAEEIRSETQTQAEFEAELAAVNWQEGSAERGEDIFAVRGCQTCHAGSTRMGPNLDGITEGFSPEDLFRMINNPDQMQTAETEVTEIITTDGESYVGELIFDTPAVKRLRLPDGVSLNINTEDIAEIRQSTSSLMPTGLLQGLTPKELADLYAYMSNL